MECKGWSRCLTQLGESEEWRSSVIALLNENRLLSRGKEKKIWTLLVPNLESCNAAQVSKQWFCLILLFISLTSFSTPFTCIFTASNQTFPAFGWMEHSAFLRRSLAIIGTSFWKCWNKYLAKHQIRCLSSLRQCGGWCFYCFPWLPWSHIMYTTDLYQTHGPVTCKTQMDSRHLLKCKQLFGR